MNLPRCARHALMPWVLVLGLRAQPADAPAPPPMVETGTRWSVLYSDNALGLRAADATVDWNRGTAELRIEGGRTLRANRVLSPAQNNGRAKIVFPLGGGDTVTRPPSVVQLGARAGELVDLVLPHGPPRELREVAAPASTGPVELTLTLMPDEDGDLRGKWSYLADPVTLAEQALAGRTGTVTIDPRTLRTEVSGLEIWTRLNPEIDYSAVVEDQAALDRVGSVWFHYHAKEPASGSEPRVRAENPGRAPPNPMVRTLILVGRHFPPEESERTWQRMEPVTIGSDRITYQRLPTNEPWAAELLAAGWARVTEGMDEKSIAMLKRFDVALVRAFLPRELPVPGRPWNRDLPEDLLPGPKTLDWLGGRTQWLLQFGDNLATLRFVRPHRVGMETRWEPVNEAFLPEEIAIELRNPAALSVPKFKVRVARGEKTVLTLEAVRREESGEAVWRTLPLRLAEASDGKAGLVGASGDQFFAGIDPNEMTFVNGAQTQLAVLDAPADAIEGRRLAPTWSKALVRAARANKMEIPASGLRDVAAKPGEGFSYFFLFSPEGKPYLAKISPERVRNDFTVGDYAAMLLLRDAFVDALEGRIEQLGEMERVPLLVKGFAHDARAAIARSATNPLANLPAGELAGRAVTLAGALDSAAVDAAFPGDAAGAEAWRIAAYGRALAAHRKTASEALTKASAIKDTDVERLLALTTRGFEPIAARVAQRLVRFDETRQLWVVDDVARGFLTGLSAKYDAVVAVKEASAKETEFFVNVATQVVGLGAMSWSKGYLGQLVAAACNGIPLVVDAAGQLGEVWTSKAEVRFALGASAVLGDARYQTALEEEGSYFNTLATIALQGVTTIVPDGSTVLHTYQAEKALVRGGGLFGRVGAGAAELGNLTSTERRDLITFALDARAAERAGRKITEAQRLAVGMWSRYERGLTRYVNRSKPEILAAAVEQIGMFATARREIAQARLAQAEVAAVSATRSKALAGLGEKEARALKEQIGNLETRSQLLELAVADAERWTAEGGARHALSEADLAWLSGRRLEPDPAVVDGILARQGNSWPAIKKAYEKTKEIAPVHMHQFVSARKERVEAMLAEAIAEVKAKNAKTISGEITFDAFGSTNLTSDFDVSVKGEGAELVVAVFNRRFAEKYGREAGLVFDTNIYTDPVYKIFGRNDLTGHTMGLANHDLDLLRQFTYDQMATRKYLHDAEAWAAHKSRLLGGADEETRGLLGHVFEEAEQANTAALEMVQQKLGPGHPLASMAEDAPELLAARNRAYEEILQEIHDWRVERRRLDRILAGEAEDLPLNAALLKKYPGWLESLAEARELAERGNAEGLKKLGDEWRARMAYKMREKQGVALYFASEAYQTEATILHVVDEIQAKKNKITVAKLLGDPRPSDIVAAGSLNSLMENRANMLKELDHVIKDGVVTDGKKASAKGAKYFIRILDAAHQAGIALKEIAPRDLLELTVGVDLVRGSMDDVAAFLASKGTTGEAFVARVMKASDELSVQVVRQPEIKRLAVSLKAIYGEVGSASEALAKGVVAAH